MTNEKLYTRVKRSVEEQRRKTVQGETKEETLKEEQARIHRIIAEELGYKVESLEQLEEILKDNEIEITEHVQKVAEVLDEEGIDY